MTQQPLTQLSPAELAVIAPVDPDGGIGALRTSAGNLPLEALELRAHLVGLTSRIELTQWFVNPHESPLEATYVFPLPDRGAVTGMILTADDRTIHAQLAERGQARQAYEDALDQGRRAAIAEEERPDVFTVRVGNILPGERVSVQLTVVGVLPVDDGEATFRFPLVVAPRYIPGRPLPRDSVGQGHEPDTDAVPDASRISPPVLLPGFPNPVRLDVEIELDPAGLAMGAPRSSLHSIRIEGNVIRVEPGARADRDLVLRIPLATGAEPGAALTLVPDDTLSSDHGEGTFELTVLPEQGAGTALPRDVVLLLDRSGSMAGWKMVAARRAAARIVDTLTDPDTFAVLAFDHLVESPSTLPAGLLPATDRNRFRAVEFLSGLQARGGTELGEPLGQALRLLSADPVDRERVVVLVTDGQVGNEDQLLRAHADAIGAVRLHTVGIDRAVNAGFLGRLASLGGGRCELVESEDRLDEAMTRIHRRIGSPLVTDLRLVPHGLALETDSVTPSRLPDLFAGVPYVVRGRFLGEAKGSVDLHGTTPDGAAWSNTADGLQRSAPAVTAAWARARLRDLEDRYVVGADHVLTLEEPAGASDLEQLIVATSLRFGVLCRFTAFVAVDERVVADGSPSRHVLQPVEPVSGWESPSASGAPVMARAMMATASLSSPTRLRKAGPAAPAVAGIVGTGAMGGGATAFPVEPPPGADEAFERTLMTAEASRLRRLSSEPDHRRREALLDLGSRIGPLAGPGRSDPRWVELLDLLRPERVAESPLESLWTAVLGLLDDLATPRDVSSGPVAWSRPAAPGSKRPAFWKHHPDR